ncbi:MAG: hypothetical protein R3C03_10790 [Pirellulaceae bacterium]
MGALVLTLARFRDSFRDIPFPFDHANKGTTLQNYLIKTLPTQDDLGEHCTQPSVSWKTTITSTSGVSAVWHNCAKRLSRRWDCHFSLIL